MRLPLSKPAAKVLFKKDFVEAAFTESLLHGLLTSKFMATGVPDASGRLADLALDGAVTGDFDKWMHDKGLKAVNAIFGGLSAGNEEALDNLKNAQADVARLNGEVAAMKKTVKQEQNKALSPVKAAQAEVAKHQRTIKSLNGKISRLTGQIGKCKQNFRECFLGKCASVPNYPARAVCRAKNLKPIAEREIVRGNLRVAEATLGLAKKALEKFRAGAVYVPAEFDPRVAGLVALRTVAGAAVTQAQKTVAEFANLESDLRKEVIAEVSKPGLVTLKQGRIRGSLAGALEGQPVILDLEYTHAGTTYKDRLAYHLFSAANDTFNDAQLEVIALGAVTKIVTAKAKAWAKEMLIAPYDFLTKATKLYLDRKGEMDEEVQKAVAIYAVDAVPDAGNFRVGKSIVGASAYAALKLRLARDKVFKDSQNAVGKIETIPDNLSFGRPVAQSSVGWEGVARLAVDGIIDGAFSTKSVTHTKKEPNPWWQVDLGAVYKIDAIRVFNRTDCCGDRLDGAKVMVSDWRFSGEPWKKLKGDAIGHYGIARAKSMNILKINRTGRYVRVQLPRSDYLQLAEVMVLGKKKVANPSTKEPPYRLPPGYLTFQVEGSGKCFDATFGNKNHTRPVTWTCNKSHPNQLFRADYKNPEWFKLVNKRNGKCVGIKSPLTKRGSAVVMFTCEDRWTDELWRKIDAGGDRFLLQTQDSKMCLDLAWAKKGNGKKFHQWNCDKRNRSQRFRLE